MDFHTRERRPRWSPRVAQEVRLPTWTYEAHQGNAIVFVHSPEALPGGEATARLYLEPATMERLATAELEVAVHGRWSEEDAARPSLAEVQDLIAEAEALLVLLGCVRPQARFVTAERTRT